MAERSVIIGRVVDMTSGAGIAGLRVEALDKSGAFFDLLGFARTDEDGRFRMEALTKDVQALVGNRLVIASLRVIQQPTGDAAPYYLLADTATSGPTWPLHGHVTEVTIRVDPAAVLSVRSSLLPFAVSGTVYGNDGPVEGVTVRLNERDPYTGDADLLTSTTTDARGRYRLTYTPPANKDSRDIFVRVDGSPYTDSEHRCHAPPSMRVDVTREGEVWRGASTYARTTEALLAAGVSAGDIKDLTDEQCERLACSLRLPEEDLRALSTAHSIAAASSALMGEARETFTEVAFAALALGLGNDRDSLFQHPKSAVRTALREAVEANQVSQAYANAGTLDTALERWVTAAAEWSLETRANPCGLGELLTVAGVTTSGDRTSFAEQLCANEAAMPDFWDGLTGTFDKGRLQLTFQWWSLARGHLPLIEKLEELRDKSEAVTLADLAKLSDSEWDSLLGDISAATPPSFPGENETEKRENYKHFLYRTMAEAFPTVHFRARADANPSELSGVKTFLNDSEINFELGKKRLSHSTYTVPLANLEPEERSRLKAIERLARFVPTYDLVDVLITKGYSSAHAMHGKGKDKFIEEMQGTPVQHVAAVVYQKACWQVRAASIVHPQYGHAVNQQPFKPFVSYDHVSSLSGIDTADWQTLFGNAGGCHCKHCAGVLGPAAYLADSLQWLDSFDSTLRKTSAKKWSALDVLVGGEGTGLDNAPGRRPDLKLLELTCKSAHTPQPYIDLTNELLEIAVANQVGPTVELGNSIKTTHEPEELAAGPEILYEVPHIRAWRSLMQRRHPFTLPVCLFDKEAEAYLRYLGVTRAEIVETMGGMYDELARARLGVRADWAIPPEFVSGWELLLGTDGGTAAEQWGLDDLDEVVDTSSLSQVPLFLRQSGLTFTELEELLATRYVNGVDGNGAAGLDPLALVENGKCDIATMTISGLSDPHLLRIHRFLRLRLHTGLSSTDLDILLAAFPSYTPPGEIDAQVLRRLTEALALARELNLTAREVAALFADLDIHERWEKKSPYRQYFLNRLVDSPVPADLEAVLLAPTAYVDLSPHTTALQQALGISRSDFTLLVDMDVLAAELFLPADQRVLQTFGNPTEILRGISQLWSHVRFARALRLKLSDYLVLRAYSGEEPVGFGRHPQHAMAFVELVRAFRSQALTVPELQWVLRAFATRGASAPNNADLEALEAEIAGAVGVIVSETASSEDAADAGAGEPADSQTRASALLGELLEPSQRDAVLVVLRGYDTPPPDNSWGDPIADIQPYLPEGARDLLAGHFEGATWHPPLLASAAERFAHVSMWLDRHIRASRAVVEKVAAAANLPVATTGYLMTSILPRQGTSAPEASLLDDFLPLNRTGSTLEDRVRGLALLLRHARLIRGLRIGEPIPASNDAPESPGEVSWIYEPSSGGLHALPAEQTSTAFLHEDDRTRFAKILQVARRVGLRDRMKGGAGALRELLQAAPPDFNDAVSLLAEKSGWEHDTLVSLCTHAGIGTTAVLLADDTLLQLEKRVSLVRRLGIAVDRVLAFYELESPPPPAEPNGLQPTTEGPPNARDLVIYARHAAKAKLSAEEWAAVAKKVRDPFRELLRDRLVDALVPSKHDTRDELYGHHLIDVDMSPCMMTSRVVQATNALQVFVQRSFLGLDGDVNLPPKAAQEWEWRKAYRLWEANRKVFLWPENWLEPDLRDDMTPLFKQFLTNLASGEITDASAERALEKYLSGLHEIARLEPMGLWYDSTSKTDHVIARTRSQPRKWFYRRREDAAWTPWEKMDVDIDAESVLLVGANQRLYLFWPQLTLKNDRPPVEADVKQVSTYVPPPGPQPMPELGETYASYKKRNDTWWENVQKWNKNLEEGGGTSTPDPEPTQHYQVRVAWSSYLDGAWTPKRMSDCDPIKIANARGDRDSGIEPKDIVLVLEPRDVPPASGILYLLCVVTSPLPPVHNTRMGRFYFDACDGGRWTATQMEEQLYAPKAPSATRLSNRGFEWNPGELFFPHVFVWRAPPGTSSADPVHLLKNHDGHYVIISPSSHNKTPKPTHEFERFLYADYKAVFHGRVVPADTTWTNGDTLALGQPIEVQEPTRDITAGGPFSQWSSSKHMQTPHQVPERYVLEIFEHPYVCEFANCLAEKGISGLLGWKNNPQSSAQYLHNGNALKTLYNPTENVAEPFPKHDVSFDFGSAYGQYNWELFFHVPFTIAQRLSQEGRYAEAQKWFHHIFNPTTGLTAGGPKRFWCVKPFYEIEDLSTIGESLSALAAASSSAATLQALIDHDEATEKAAADLETQILAMSKKPFSPHTLARLRPLAYMKNVFMRYIENILDWGDNLFRRDTMESIHEALTLYLLAADLLGPRPQIIEHKADPAGKTFKELLTDGLDSFGNAAVEVENIVPKIPPPGFECTDDGPPMPDFRLYFCVPPNEQLYGLWDTVADRLFKIRNCMNIEGVARSLPLFAPPIDPAILVRAAAAGVRLDQVLDALAAPAPLYRFVRLHAKAVEFAGAVQALGQGLLSALEKKDGEELALLRQRHEVTVLDAERDVRKHAIQEAKETLGGLNRSLQTARTRLAHYTGLLAKGLIPEEKRAEDLTRMAGLLRTISADIEIMGAVAAAIPDTSAGICSGTTLGGRAVQLAANALGRSTAAAADTLSTSASLAQTAAGHARRAEEWKLQKSLAEKEIAQLEKQIAAQEIRVAIAERELDNLDLRREHSREVDAFYRSKFTSQELYTWMSAQLASEHYRAYQTAYDMAKRAERAYQLERGDETSFIRFGAWDSLKKGLLAGERLLQDLRALDAAYLSRSDREREITKHISLAEVAGEELTRLRDIGDPSGQGGKAEIELPPYLFDADYPGQYFRRIKNVAITVATVKSAADGVQCELTLLKSAIRKNSKLGTNNPYPSEPYADDGSYRFSQAPVKVLATSTAENDPGLFEVNLKDEMLLPVEGSGAISQWRIEIDHRTNRFPMHRISDVVLHLRYTAKDGGALLRKEALDYADGTLAQLDSEAPPGLTQRTRVFSARRDFEEAWAAFTAGQRITETPEAWANRLELRFVQSQFRSFFGDPKVDIVRVQVSATFNDKYEAPASAAGTVDYELTPPEDDPRDGSIDFRIGEPKEGHNFDTSPVEVPRDDASPQPWVFQILAPESLPSEPIGVDRLRSESGPHILLPDAFEDIWFTVTYERRQP